MQLESIRNGLMAALAVCIGDMDGRKMDWIRKQLGMTKVEFHRELGVSRMHLLRCLRDGPPKLVALAGLGLWYSRQMGGLMEKPSAPPETKPAVKRRRRKA